jgi:hypothetical protein
MAHWWENKDLWIGLAGFGGIVAALQLGGYDPIGKVTFEVTNVFARGNRLTYGTLNDGSGIVLEDPETLRSAASSRFGQDLSSDVYALARMVRSEGAKEGRLRVHVALNDQAALGWSSPFVLLTYSTDPQRKGMFGRQYSAAAPPQYPNKMVRRYATSKDPYEGDVQTVLAALAEHDQGIDPSLGATKFLDKGSFGIQEGTGSWAAKDAQWLSEGNVAYTVPEYGDDLVLYRKV